MSDMNQVKRAGHTELTNGMSAQSTISKADIEFLLRNDRSTFQRSEVQAALPTCALCTL